MAIIAAIKKVLSPSSVNRITEIDAVNASIKFPFDFDRSVDSFGLSAKLLKSVGLFKSACKSKSCGEQENKSS